MDGRESGTSVFRPPVVAALGFRIVLRCVLLSGATALEDFVGAGWQAGMPFGTVVWLNSVSFRGMSSLPES